MRNSDIFNQFRVAELEYLCGIKFCFCGIQRNGRKADSAIPMIAAGAENGQISFYDLRNQKVSFKIKQTPIKFMHNFENYLLFLGKPTFALLQATPISYLRLNFLEN